MLTLREIGRIIGESLCVNASFSVRTESQPRDLIGNIDRMVAVLGKPTERFADRIREVVV